ncbi:hypothetical protein [Streptomyces shenzhenensis]|uniref:hypothetical protein n=1 Tax=Streptomyces shenzhenensis TaxID=943815 RepID=UPI001604A8AF|nr:hypothetical protein [Streptomyces shenzhenensis]
MPGKRGRPLRVPSAHGPSVRVLFVRVLFVRVLFVHARPARVPSPRSPGGIA